jgi:hypothetical protein
MKKGTIAAAALVASMIFGQTAFAQDTQAPQAQEQKTTKKFSDEDLQKFITANIAVTEIQKEGREAMVSAIEDSGLTVDRFNELAKAHRQGKLKEVAEGKEEITAFTEAAKSMVKVQPETEDKVNAAITEAGLTSESYQKILAAFQKDPVIETRIKQLLAK